jgi:hypothetical protein
MFEIRELTGQEYHNVYAGKTADSEPAATPARVGSVDDALAEPVSVAAGDAA